MSMHTEQKSKISGIETIGDEFSKSRAKHFNPTKQFNDYNV